MSLKYTVTCTPYHILLETIPLKWIYSGAKYLTVALCKNLVNIQYASYFVQNNIYDMQRLGEQAFMFDQMERDVEG